MAVVEPAGFSRDAIEACLDRITESQHFSRSRRLVRFLRFTVESMLEGRADELKERTIGVDVYGRPLDFDPRADPIVRSEAHRLRARLAAYYAREGSADPIVIEVPKGGYAPRLRANATEPDHELAGCRVIVSDFDDPGAGECEATRAAAFGEALRARLAASRGVHVLYRVSGTQPSQRSSAHVEADYRVEGVFEHDGDSFAVTVRLVRLADEREIWSETERFASKRIGDVEESWADHLAASIGATLKRRSRQPRPAADRAYDFFVRGRHSAIQYSNTLDARHLEPARRRLEAALEHDPEYADALAELANLELLRLYPPRGDAEQVVANARAYLERSLALEPLHARSLYLLGHIEGSALRPREALRLTESAVAIDPEDSEGRTMLAARYASLGYWESAVVACDWALALDSVWEAPYKIKAYLLTRMGEFDAARLAIDELARVSTSPTELAVIRFDLRVAEGSLSDARAALASPESTFSLRPDQEDRRELARALADALEGRYRDARSKLEAHLGDGPRFWDHSIRLALAVGKPERALELFLANPINRTYRWLANELRVRPHLHHPRWQAVVGDLHEGWLRDLEEVGPRLPAPPPPLATPAELLRSAAARPL